MTALYWARKEEKAYSKPNSLLALTESLGGRNQNQIKETKLRNILRKINTIFWYF